MSELVLFDPLRGRPADLPLIREELLERIELLRAGAAEPSEIQEAIDDYEFYTALGRRRS
jgi:hypothetical protein